MKKSILLATDFYENSQNAIDYAIQLYKEYSCDFYILNTYNVEDYAVGFTAARGIEESKKKSIAGLANILERLSFIDDSINHKFHMISECGSLIEIMKEIIDKRDIDMVVMGTKGNTASRAQMYGSHTVLAMEKIRNCPVLVIPAETIFKEIKEIVFPTGYRIHYKKREFQYLIDIAKGTNATIHILNILDEDEQLDEDQLNNQKLLKDYFNGLEHNFHTVRNIEVQTALHSFIESHDIDMVTFINKKHNFFSNLFSRRQPMMKELGYYSTIPVLTLHDFKN